MTKTDGGAAWEDAPQTGITQEQADARYLQLSGGTISGPVTMNNVFKVYDGYIDAIQITSSEGNLILGASSVVTLAPTAKTISVSNSRIINVATPTSNTDAANKAYVDQQVVAAGGVVTGTYTGNGSTAGQTINLGFRPKLFAWYPASGLTSTTGGYDGPYGFGFIVDDDAVKEAMDNWVEITNTGVIVYGKEDSRNNNANENKLYLYFAVK